MKNYRVSLNLLSKYRTTLMAIGILLVMFCHSTVQVDGQLQYACTLTKKFAQIGVDMFLLLSGIGIYCSLDKNSSLKSFYSKRLIKILPAYILVLAVWAFVQVFFNTIGGVKEFVYCYSLITFYLRGDTSEWYIAAILLLYFISPWIYKAIRGGRKNLICSIGVVWLISAACFVCTKAFAHTKFGNAFFTVNELLVVRVPLYLVGMYFGKLFSEQENSAVSLRKILWVFLIGVMLFILNTAIFPQNKLWFSQWYLTRVIFGVLCIPMLLLICTGLESWSKKKRPKKVPLTLIGAMTLELYLIHAKALSVFDKYFTKDLLTSIISNAAADMVSLILGFAIHRLAALISNRVLQKQS